MGYFKKKIIIYFKKKKSLKIVYFSSDRSIGVIKVYQRNNYKKR